MFVKLELTGKLEILTGLHIGGESAFAAIGAVDSPVVRDPLSNEPMIPGSSLKGKLRALLARQYNGNRIVKTCDQDDLRICRLFRQNINNLVSNACKSLSKLIAGYLDR